VKDECIGARLTMQSTAKPTTTTTTSTTTKPARTTKNKKRVTTQRDRPQRRTTTRPGGAAPRADPRRDEPTSRPPSHRRHVPATLDYRRRRPLARRASRWPSLALRSRASAWRRTCCVGHTLVVRFVVVDLLRLPIAKRRCGTHHTPRWLWRQRQRPNIRYKSLLLTTPNQSANNNNSLQRAL
jgi:hypothetical protein